MLFFTANAFTAKPFSGNPAAVVITDTPQESELMQKIAVEFNLPATTFLSPTLAGGHGGVEWSIRWFAPSTEIPLCGHGTLAAAHILYETGKLASSVPAQFTAPTGKLSARKVGDKIELDTPAIFVSPAELPKDAITYLGATPIGYYTGDHGWQLVEFDSEATVRNLKPNFPALVKIGLGRFGITARASTNGFDIVSRMFVPQHGIDEDQATGSMHCMLSPFWSARLKKQVISAYQASRRGGQLEIEHSGSRVLLRGQAVTMSTGTLAL